MRRCLIWITCAGVSLAAQVEQHDKLPLSESTALEKPARSLLERKQFVPSAKRLAFCDLGRSGRVQANFDAMAPPVSPEEQDDSDFMLLLGMLFPSKLFIRPHSGLVDSVRRKLNALSLVESDTDQDVCYLRTRTVCRS